MQTHGHNAPRPPLGEDCRLEDERARAPVEARSVSSVRGEGLERYSHQSLELAAGIIRIDVENVFVRVLLVIRQAFVEAELVLEDLAGRVLRAALNGLAGVGNVKVKGGDVFGRGVDEAERVGSFGVGEVERCRA